MKKILKIFLLICLMFIIISIINKSTRKYKIEYETWFDTRNVFGNGEYQQYDNLNGGLNLYNMKYQSTIIESVTNYVEKDNIVCFKGYNWDDIRDCTLECFAVLNLETNVIKYYVVDYSFEDYLVYNSLEMRAEDKMIVIFQFDEFTEEEKNILNSL